jgi:hypothetical protein
MMVVMIGDEQQLQPSMAGGRIVRARARFVNHRQIN